MKDLRKQWNDTCLAAGIDSISAGKAAKIMAVLMELGNNEAMTHNTHFLADVDYIRTRYRIGGGLIPDAVFAEYLKEYAEDLRGAISQNFIPQWAERLFREEYEIKLYC